MTALAGPGKSLAFQRCPIAGNTITAYASPDGVQWTLVGSDTIAMSAVVYVGLAVSSHTTAAAATAAFANVSLTTLNGTP